ncbi:MAG: 1,4-dihydroxy-2-naphthoate octaprenyltransferase [Candidatus Binataceae bacterium]|nr:1,4-dihydroxy-2-naphthoate octaprenyltransferase [Candidatus Binataceae bacterium]
MAAEAITVSGGTGPNPISLWLQAIRVRTLVVMPPACLVGAACALADGHFSLFRLILAFFGTAAIQSGTNIINDYYDFQSGVDPREAANPDPFGPSLVVQRGLLTPDQLWWGGIAAFGIGAVFGLILVALCGWPILLIGVASIAAAYFYTARPLALAYHALGDITGFIFMGPAIVIGGYYVMAFNVTWGAVLTSCAVGFLGTGILLANNVRDIETDPQRGKYTLSTWLGRDKAIWEVALFDAGAYLSIAIGILIGAISWLALIVLITLPRAFDEIAILRRERDWDRLNLALKRSAQLHLEFCILLIVAFAIRAIFRH